MNDREMNEPVEFSTPAQLRKVVALCYDLVPKLTKAQAREMIQVLQDRADELRAGSAQ